MFSAIFFRKVLPFVITFFCGAGLATLFSGTTARDILPVSDPLASSGTAFNKYERCKKRYRSYSSVQFISKPRAEFTEIARANETQGTVTLRVTFLASGEVGPISVVAGLPDGLTDQAIEAARNIKFEPKMVNGEPATTTMAVQYSFAIY